MKLSAPIHVLKSQAKSLKKQAGITSVEALNRIAQQEGYSSWSLLKSRENNIFPNSYGEILDFFNDGDLVLIGGRPGQGKTIFTLGLLVQALQKQVFPGYVFTLCETPKSIIERIKCYNSNIVPDGEKFVLDYSNKICAEYIIEQTRGKLKSGSIIVIDYLQQLDEKRVNPPIQEQIVALKAYAKEQKCKIIFISQIRREVEYQESKTLTIKDVRSPNPFDKNLINKMILMQQSSKDPSKVSVQINSKTPHQFEVNFSREKRIFY